jgi:drug/metabolite transporter (DMT)-like permease
MSITRMTHDTSRRTVGLVFALLSAATFGTSGTFADCLMRTGWTPAAVVTVRITLAAGLLTAPAVASMHGRWRMLRPALPSVVVFGLVAVAGCQLFFFNAVQHLTVGVALLLEYSAVLLVVLWMWLRHSHRPRRLTVLGGCLALLGLVLVLNPGTGGIDPVGAGWGLLASGGLAVYFVLSARSDQALPPLALAWAAMVVGAATLIVLDLVHALAFHTASRDVILFDHRTSWIVPVVGLSLVAAAIAYAAGVTAARLLGAKVASFVGLTEVLFAVLIAWLLLGQAPGVGQLIGGVAVLAGITLVRADETSPTPVAPPNRELVVASPRRDAH